MTFSRNFGGGILTYLCWCLGPNEKEVCGCLVALLSGFLKFLAVLQTRKGYSNASYGFRKACLRASQNLAMASRGKLKAVAKLP